MTQHYDRNKYDELAEVTNEDAFEMCVKLNKLESIIAGPSSGMQVVGATRLMKDEPGNVGVIIFCDDIFKYTASCTRHVPSIFPPTEERSFEPAELTALRAVLDAQNSGPDTMGKDALAELKPALNGGDHAPVRIIDVRPPEEFSSRLRAKGAVNIPMATLMGMESQAEQVEQVYNLPGAVRKKKSSDNGEPPAKRARNSVHEALRAAFGTVPERNTRMLLV
eukprot:gnl/TRDRNA2_/TRDRNA2_172023_c0_seq1.p1 gnl/TRDRNA2_/TRDRNA2_172023_c0~~gnl/TRDRNA2_/TRDRNA2_172023_c0_seq1.p1  ORF type:complete len:222 (-),score=50.40 gnl/TRDRNA2_/TRDRNA2_172023_c0_seq1:531-1196(-)